MKNYSTMNTMQCFSSQNSLSNSSKDSKQMFLTTRRGEPLIPTSNYLQNHHLQNQSILNQQQQQQQQQQNYPCVHPHHTVLSSSCSPSISSNSINVWTTINNSAGIKQSIDKVPPHYSALTTLGRLNTLHNTNLHNNSLLNSNLVHNKQNNHRKDTFRWRSNDKGFCFLLLIIGCILTFVLLIFSLIFYFIVFKQGVTFDLNTPNKTISTALTTSNLVNKFNPNLKPESIDKFKQLPSSTYEQPKMKRKRLINKIDGELRIMNKQFKLRDYDNEILLLKQVLNNFIQRNLNLCLNNTEITQYRRGDNHNLNGIIVNFILTFDCALPNLPKRLAFALRDSFKSDYQIDFRTLRLTPVFDQHSKIEYVDVLESEADNWLKFTKNSEWGKWTEWSQCDCKNGLVVKSRQRTCLNKTTNKSAFSFSCGNNNDDNDEHLPSVEIKNCGCDQIPDSQFDTTNKNNHLSSSTSINSQSNNNPEQFELAICSRCEKTSEICLSYNSQMPNCLKILNYDDKCGGHCNSKGTECKYVKEKYLHQCIHTNETTDGNLCLDDEFKCLDGLCIPNIKYCDGFPNCFDSSDEVGCQCDIESGEYMHCSVNSTSCIHISKRCDQVDDCLHSEDEIGCFKNCPSEDEENSNQVFHCLSGSKECIPIDKLCNGFRDCFDGSDEINCKLTNLNQHRNRFNITN